jgi:outer membrane protein OmpA-like peptidoglycan-associated protein
MKIFLYIIPLFFLTISCKAQVNVYKYSTKSEKAIKAYEKATAYYDKYDDVNALEQLELAVKTDPKFIEAYLLMGDMFTEIAVKSKDMGMFKEDVTKVEKAIAAYRKAVEIDPDFFMKTYLNLAANEISIGKYEDAKTDLEYYMNSKNLSPVNSKRAEILLASAVFGIKAMKNPVPFNPVNLGDSVNSPNNDYLPSLTADEQTLVITVRKPRDAYTIGMNKDEEDFYISYYKDSVWTKSVPIGPPLNTHGNEGAQCISPDGVHMFFTACNREGGFGSCDLYYSKKTGTKWSIPENMGPAVNSSGWDSQPSISADGKNLYFTSNRAGGKGGMDIWMSTMGDDGYWDKPVNLGDSINTAQGEMAPFIHPDNKTFYFTTNGRPGLGGFDIYYSKKDDNGNFTKPVNLGYPINTFADESYLIVNSYGDKAYFASDLPGGKGGFDIYSFDLYEGARPEMVTYLKGTVYNSVSKDKLEARFELIDIKTGKSVIVSYSDVVSGEFLVSLPANKDYALNISKDGYLFYSENFTLSGTHSSVKPFVKDIPLQPIKVGETVVLKNIFFDTDKYELKPESDAELEKLITLLKKNPKMKIEINGHTDNVGADAYNQVLSENRSKAVYEYLVKLGIAKDRLSYKGYGETKPIDTNDTEAGKANNRRTEFKVVAM